MFDWAEKCLPGKNTLAYFYKMSMAKKKSFTTLIPDKLSQICKKTEKDHFYFSIYFLLSVVSMSWL